MSARTDRAQELVAHGCIQPDRACVGKVAYPTQNEARHAAKIVARAKQRRVDTYHCPFCALWHLTKRKHGEEED